MGSKQKEVGFAKCVKHENAFDGAVVIIVLPVNVL